jgi:DNA-directed RNA polymerase subunit RPC12/RpoP
MEKSVFKLIRRYQYSSEAIIFKGKLESEGISVFIRDNNTVDTYPLYSNAVGGVKLFVKNDDFIKANEILSQVSEYSLDEMNQLVNCPKCNGKQIKMITSIKDIKTLIAFIFSMLFVLMPFYSKHTYRCNTCSFEFK